MSAQARRIEERTDDQAQEVLNAFGGDALQALRSVIADAEYLCDELERTAHNVSFGYVRGSKPRFQRDT
jgi:hypothetical protein